MFEPDVIEFQISSPGQAGEVFTQQSVDFMKPVISIGKLPRILQYFNLIEYWHLGRCELV